MAISGKNGTVNGSGATITSWTINIETDMLDCTDMGSDGYREFVEGLKGATGTLVANERFTGGATVALANASNTYSGSVLFNSEAVETPVDGLVTYTHGITFTGSITVA